MNALADMTWLGPGLMLAGRDWDGGGHVVMGMRIRMMIGIRIGGDEDADSGLGMWMEMGAMQPPSRVIVQEGATPIGKFFD